MHNIYSPTISLFVLSIVMSLLILVDVFNLSFQNLRVFGCLCFSTKLNVTDKFAERAEKCILLGYSLEQKGYKLLSLDTNSVFVSRDVKFYESVLTRKRRQHWPYPI